MGYRSDDGHMPGPVEACGVPAVPEPLTAARDRAAITGERDELRTEAQRLREEIAALRSERDAARGERDTARAELEDAAAVYRAEAAHTRRYRDERDRYRTAWRNAARRARASRALRKAVAADRDRLAEVGAATVATWRERAAFAEADARETRRRIGEIDGRVAAVFAAADRDGVSLDAMTVAQLTALVMAAVDGSTPDSA